MKNLGVKAWSAVAALAIAMALLLFVPAGTVRYWQAWVYLSIFTAASALTTFYLLRTDRALLERRMRGGPTGETRPVQKLIMLGTSLGFIALMVVSALFLGTPLALGAYWGLVVIAAMVPLLIWRLLDEERFLSRNLPGYAEYGQQARYRDDGDALPRLAEEGDAVLMDLRGFTASHAGCIHELRYPAQNVPFDRCVLIVDDTTDEHFLERTLNEARGRRVAHVPQRRPLAVPV